MVIHRFTDEQRAWLGSLANQYKSRLGKQESGFRFARERAEEFVEKWSSLADGRILNSEDMIEKVLTWFRNSNQKERKNNRELRMKNKRSRNGRCIRHTNLRLSTVDRVEESGEPSSSEEDTLPHDASAVARLQSTSIMDFPNFGSYFQTDEEHIYRKWKKYAAAVERRHVFIQKLKKLIKLDENEYPQVPVMGYDLKELGEALTIYLEQTWYKLHEHIEDITIATIPWSDVELNSAQYLRTSALPPSLIPFQAPNRVSAAKIVQLHSFLEDNADRPFPERFPFIIQSKISVKLKRARSIVVNNKTQLQTISQDASSMDEMSDEVTPTKRRRSYKSWVGQVDEMYETITRSFG